MQIYLGQDKLLDMTLGTPQISEVYIGNTRIFPGFYGIQTVDGGRAYVFEYTSTGTAYSSINLLSDGTINLDTAFDKNINPIWFDRQITGIGNNYWVRARSISGTPGTGTLNTWLQLNTTRSWVRSAAFGNYREWIIELDFSTDSSGSNIIGTYNILLQAQSGGEKEPSGDK